MRQGLCSIMRRTSPSWRTMWPKMDPAQIELPGLVGYQVPERGSANDRSVVLYLPSCSLSLDPAGFWRFVS